MPTAVVYDTTFKIDQTLFLKISKFRNFQNSFPYAGQPVNVSKYPGRRETPKSY
jgi:hypothetical protein